MVFPPNLKAGDKIGIVAPARKISELQLQPAINILQSWRLEPTLSKNLFSTSHSYLAGNDKERIEDFQSMIDDPEIKAIFCARGGYGSTRIIDEIDFQPLSRNPKWVIGFSDVTAFHLRLMTIGIPSIHGTMPIFYGRKESESSVESIRKILFDGKCQVEAPPSEHNRTGTAIASVIGGNLSLIVDSLNTPSEPDLQDRILILEEVDEYFYKLDRMFTQLRRTGKLRNLAGLVIGHMTDIKNSDLDFGETVEQIITHTVRDYHYPVAFSFPTGHEELNLAWIQGAEAELSVSMNKVALRYPNIYSKME